MKLSVAVQHHPARPHLLQPMLAALMPGPPVQIIRDPEPESRLRAPWRTYRRALAETPVWATHRCVIQDDAVPCQNFQTAATRAAAARPEALLVLAVLGTPSHWINAVRTASDRGDDWAELRVGFWASWIPAIAVIWPAGFIGPFLDWYAEQDFPAGFQADDAIIGLGAAALGWTVLATVPSLVDHPDVAESTLGRRAAAGRNPDRVVPCFIGDCDALTIDWEQGPS